MRKSKGKRGLTCGVWIVLLVASIAILVKHYIKENGQSKTPFESNEQIKDNEQIKGNERSANTLRPNPPGGVSASQPFSKITINSSHALLVQLDKNGNKILFDKGGEERIYPASMTKIMTAIVALENIKDLNTSVTLNEEMFTGIYNNNSSVAGFLPGEKVRTLDLLYGLMLPSGAECSIGLAEYVSGTERAFVDLMNKKARQLGLDGTHFANSTGLHNQDHYSTVKDIAVLLEYALKNDTFYKIFTTASYSTKPTNRHKDGFTFYSTMFSKMESAKFKGGIILGGKTGYTSEAGQCLASLAKKDGKRFILVTSGAPGDGKTQQLHIDDAIMVFNKIN